ncbi:MAG: TetR/AcrR family transcriptional regulator [Desulfobacterales bacterium]
MNQPSTNKTDKKQQIFKAALSLFAHYGYRKTTLEDVAAKVGMTKGNIYFYVKNKQDLYEKAVGYALENWRRAVAASGKGGTARKISGGRPLQLWLS